MLFLHFPPILWFRFVWVFLQITIHVSSLIGYWNTYCYVVLVIDCNSDCMVGFLF